MNPFFTDYSEYLGIIFPDFKVQKISVNTGRSCPNRDGTLGTGGCIYCDNSSFTPSYCSDDKSVSRQISDGKRFFARKYPEMKYLAYFQSFTPTNSSPDELRRDIEEAMEDPDVAGTIVAGRPDCISDQTISVLKEAARRKPVFVELGVETLDDNTLHIINRGHDSATAEDAIRRIAAEGIPVGVHLIEGLPGEDISTMLDTARRICSLPVDSIKFHQLQVIKDTPLQRLLNDKKMSIHRFTIDTYLDLCVKLIGIVPKSIAIERFLASSPPAMVEYPRWGIKNFEFTHKLLKRLQEDCSD